MFKCHVCGGTAARNEFVSEVFAIDGPPRAGGTDSGAGLRALWRTYLLP